MTCHQPCRYCARSPQVDTASERSCVSVHSASNGRRDERLRQTQQPRTQAFRCATNHPGAAGANWGTTMQYPVYVHRDTATAFRASFPDFPGADVAGNSLEELKRNAQNIVELKYDGSEQLIPTPTCDTSELRRLEMDDGEGIWLFLDINMSRVTSRVVGLHISLREDVLNRVDSAARERHLTRSAFFTLAVLHELETQAGR
jgi:predicted RNase H-like HicB family nuclease